MNRSRDNDCDAVGARSVKAARRRQNSAVLSCSEEWQCWQECQSVERKYDNAHTENHRQKDIENERVSESNLRALPKSPKECRIQRGRPDKMQLDGEGPKNAACPPVCSPTLSTIYLRNRSRN